MVYRRFFPAKLWFTQVDKKQSWKLPFWVIKILSKTTANGDTKTLLNLIPYKTHDYFLLLIGLGLTTADRKFFAVSSCASQHIHKRNAILSRNNQKVVQPLNSIFACIKKHLHFRFQNLTQTLSYVARSISENCLLKINRILKPKLSSTNFSEVVYKENVIWVNFTDVRSDMHLLKATAWSAKIEVF